MTATEYVVLVDETDTEIGLAEKITAHQKNLLHRAFSVFIYRKNSGIELLLQQRALHKYHSPGLWTNTCCSHPRLGEDLVQAGKRRLFEELGVSAELQNIGWFHYNAHFDNGLSENEIDHVLIGKIPEDTNIAHNPDEVHNYRWIGLKELESEIAAKPQMFTPWLPLALQKVKAVI